MIGLILVTHGALADEFIHAMEHVVGRQPDIVAVCIGPNDDMERRRKEIADAIKRVDSGSGVIIRFKNGFYVLTNRHVIRYAQAGNIWRYDPATGATTIFRSPSGMSNGIKFDRDGNMLAALGADYGGRMLIKTDMATGKSFILSGTYNATSYKIGRAHV